MTLAERLLAILNLRRTPPEKPAELRAWGSAAAAGVRVDEDVALTYSAVWACVRVISETIAALPWHLYEKGRNRREEIDANTNTVAWLLHYQANPEMSAMVWRETTLAHALLWGNAYSEIERDGAGRPTWLWLLSPDRVQVVRDAGGETLYKYQPEYGDARAVPARDMLHLRGLGWNGLVGYSVVRMAAESIGLGLGQQRAAASIFGNSVNPSGVLEAEHAVKQEQLEALRDAWRKAYRGPGKAGETIVLPLGLKYKPVTMPLADAQFLESRQFQVDDICRWFRVPPHKVASLGRATWSNIEHQSIEFVTDTLMPWVARLETEANQKLLGRNQQGRLYTRINLQGLLRGDANSRFQAYAIGRQWGWLSANDIRRLEDMDPIPDGDQYLVPVNMTLADRMDEEIDARVEPPEPPAPPAAVAPEPESKSEEKPQPKARARKRKAA